MKNTTNCISWIRSFLFFHSRHQLADSHRDSTILFSNESLLHTQISILYNLFLQFIQIVLFVCLFVVNLSVCFSFDRPTWNCFTFFLILRCVSIMKLPTSKLSIEYLFFFHFERIYHKFRDKIHEYHLK